ncbi:2Fe-2S iron-sulfur cluster-binding protein [Streptomyces sp. NPDC001231]|uniref:2Fe-2S iron-sulfur cluster-binding protein n=1 Tax=Streptomyces sp. NPDC001231 TaxID=3364549 RepID=UPI0036C0B080
MTDDQHAEGTPGSGGRWDPLPQGEYDDGATAFVKLPEGGIDALLAADSPLAAPGHGYVPPPIAVTPAPQAATDPAGTGGWAVPGVPAQGTQWPDPNAVPQDAGAGADDRFTYRPEATQQWNFDEAQAGPAAQAPPAPRQDVTGQWSIPVAGGDIPDESGEFTTSSLVQQWGGTPPTTLPGGAAAPWATEEVGQAWSRPRTGAEAPGQPGEPTAGGPHGSAPAANTYENGPTGAAFPAGGPGGGGQGAGAAEAAYGARGDAGLPGASAAGGAAGGGSPAGRPGGGGQGAGAAEAAYGARGDAGLPAAFAAGGVTGGGSPAGGPGGGGNGAGAAEAAYGTAVDGSRADVRLPGVHAAGGAAGGGSPAGVPGAGAHGAGAVQDAYRAGTSAGGAREGEPAASGAGHADGRSAGVRHPAEEPASEAARPFPPIATGPGADTAATRGPEAPHGQGAAAVPGQGATGSPAERQAQLRAEQGAQASRPRSESTAEPDADSPRPASGAVEAGKDPREAGEAAEGPAGPPARPGSPQKTQPSSRAAGEPVTGSGSATPDGAAAGPDPDAGQPDAATQEDPPPAPPQDEHPLASYVLRVNGADRPVTDAWIGESLLYVLRERLGLAGAKDGCSQGECGACNVQVDGRLVASCLVPAVTAAGSEVRTVEGLAVDGQPSDVQRALARCGAVQCGFCVPGMAMTVHDLLEGNPDPTELETRQALCGNLCRCTGYRGVLQAVKEVVTEREVHTAADEAEQEAEEPRIPHQAGPGAGGVHPSALDTPAPHDPYGQDGGQA